MNRTHLAYLVVGILAVLEILIVTGKVFAFRAPWWKVLLIVLGVDVGIAVIVGLIFFAFFVLAMRNLH